MPQNLLTAMQRVVVEGKAGVLRVKRSGKEDQLLGASAAAPGHLKLAM